MQQGDDKSERLDKEKGKRKEKVSFWKKIASKFKDRKKTQQFVVLWDFDAADEDEISLEKGDRVYVLEERYSDDTGSGGLRWKWCNVQKGKNKKEVGYIPRSFLVQAEDYDTSTFYTNTTWYIGRSYPLEAQEILKGKDVPRGTFVVCAPPDYKSRIGLPEYSLLIRISSTDPIPMIDIYRICRDKAGRYYLNPGDYAPNLYILLRRLSNTPGALKVPLRCPDSPSMHSDSRTMMPKIPSPPAHPARFFMDSRASIRGSRSSISLTERSMTGLFGKKNPWNPYGLKRNELKYKELIGKGNFGNVYRAMWNRPIDRGPVEVAVKELKESTNIRKATLQKEARVLSKLTNDNIIKFYAFCDEKEPLLLVTEFMNKGSLLKFLRHRFTTEKPLKEKELVEILYQIARGMAYLAKKNVVHRDLAARNILISEERVGITYVKISDFGLSKDLQDKNGDKNDDTGSELPYKWMAPECLRRGGEFTEKSDVWSFGVLMYEVMTHGEIPYRGVDNQNMLEYLSGGKRLERPKEMNRRLYKMADRCWQQKPSNRPDFQTIYKELDALLNNPLAYYLVL